MGAKQSKKSVISNDHPTLFNAKVVSDYKKAKAQAAVYVVLEVCDGGLTVHHPNMRNKITFWPLKFLQKYQLSADNKYLIIRTGPQSSTGMGVFLFHCLRAEEIYRRLKDTWTSYVCDIRSSTLSRPQRTSHNLFSNTTLPRNYGRQSVGYGRSYSINPAAIIDEKPNLHSQNNQNQNIQNQFVNQGYNNSTTEEYSTHYSYNSMTLPNKKRQSQHQNPINQLSGPIPGPSDINNPLLALDDVETNLRKFDMENQYSTNQISLDELRAFNETFQQTLLKHRRVAETLRQFGNNLDNLDPKIRSNIHSVTTTMTDINSIKKSATQTTFNLNHTDTTCNNKNNNTDNNNSTMILSGSNSTNAEIESTSSFAGSVSYHLTPDVKPDEQNFENHVTDFVDLVKSEDENDSTSSEKSEIKRSCVPKTNKLHGKPPTGPKTIILQPAPTCRSDILQRRLKNKANLLKVRNYTLSEKQKEAKVETQFNEYINTMKDSTPRPQNQSIRSNSQTVCYSDSLSNIAFSSQESKNSLQRPCLTSIPNSKFTENRSIFSFETRENLNHNPISCQPSTTMLPIRTPGNQFDYVEIVKPPRNIMEGSETQQNQNSVSKLRDNSSSGFSNGYFEDRSSNPRSAQSSSSKESTTGKSPAGKKFFSLGRRKSRKTIV